MNNRYKPVGWRNESHRHYLAAKGIKTSYMADKGEYFALLHQMKNKDVNVKKCCVCGEHKEHTSRHPDMCKDCAAKVYMTKEGHDEFYAKKIIDSDDLRANKEYFDELAEVGTNAEEVKEVSRDMYDEYISAGFSPAEARERVKIALENSAAFEKAVETSDDPDKILYGDKFYAMKGDVSYYSVGKNWNDMSAYDRVEMLKEMGYSQDSANAYGADSWMDLPANVRRNLILDNLARNDQNNYYAMKDESPFFHMDHHSEAPVKQMRTQDIDVKREVVMGKLDAACEKAELSDKDREHFMKEFSHTADEYLNGHISKSMFDDEIDRGLKYHMKVNGKKLKLFDWGTEKNEEKPFKLFALKNPYQEDQGIHDMLVEELMSAKGLSAPEAEVYADELIAKGGEGYEQSL